MKRARFVIRKQKPGMPRPGKPMKWIGACQRCGRALASEQWSDVIDWVNTGHVCVALPSVSVGCQPPSVVKFRQYLACPETGRLSR